jgi:hypothetical protein
MKPSPITASLLTSLAKIFFGVAGCAFLVGGGLLHAETQMSRFLAEVIGLSVAAACILLGFLANTLAGVFNPKEEKISIKTPD